MNFFDKLRDLGVKALINKVHAFHVRQTGLPGGALADSLCDANEQHKTAVAAALNNADTDFVLLSVLENDPEAVMKGLAAAATVLGTENKTLYVPENREELAEALRPLAGEYGVTVKSEFVNVRENENALLLHIATCADLAHAIEGDYAPGVWVSVDGGEVKRVPDGTKISDLCDLTGAKGLILGYEMRPVKDAALTVEEANLANGVVRVLREHDCVVAETQKRLLASRARSCGKCVFCREGLLQLEYEHREMTEGRGKPEYIDLTHEIGTAMCFSTPCSMGQTSARIALSAQDNFPEEYEDHIKKHRCGGDVCTAFQHVYVDPKACTGCAACMTACPEDAIDGAEGYIHIVFDNGCTRCRKCLDVCPEGAIHLTHGTAIPKLPPKMMRVGRLR